MAPVSGSCRDPPRGAGADQVIARLNKKLARIEGISVFMQPAQDITIGARLNRLGNWIKSMRGGTGLSMAERLAE